MSESIVLGDRYKLDRVIGRGGMAEVWSGLDLRLDRMVAVKRLRVDLATDPTFQARFQREAQSAAALNHPNIVSVYDTGEQVDSPSGIAVPYIVMELVEGHTLKEILKDGRRIVPEKALEFTMGVLDALGYSHRNGIVHRDIKPANVMITPTGQVKVMDFGIARAVADTSATMTQTAAVIGTAQYLSPEQARGETVDARSDIYSSGCLLYELLTGRPPFIGDSPVSVAYQHVREAPVPPSQLDPEITPGMEAITLKALAKDPADRYQSAREMREDIARLLNGEAVTALLPVQMGGVEPGATQILPPRALIEPTDTTQPIVNGANGATPLREATAVQTRRGLSTASRILVFLLVLITAAAAFFVWRWNQPAPQDELVIVPRVIGYPEEAAKSMLITSKLTPEVMYAEGPAVTKNQVTHQNPQENLEVRVGSTVTITINTGPKQTAIPDVVGAQEADARKALLAAGFTNVDTQPATSEPNSYVRGQVTAVSPSVGVLAATSDKITLTVATGQSQMPTLTNMDQAAASQVANRAGFFNLSVTKRQTDDATPGEVIEQSPEPGVLHDRTARVTIVVAEPLQESSSAPSESASESSTANGRGRSSAASPSP